MLIFIPSPIACIGPQLGSDVKCALVTTKVEVSSPNELVGEEIKKIIRQSIEELVDNDEFGNAMFDPCVRKLSSTSSLPIATPNISPICKYLHSYRLIHVSIRNLVL